MQRHKLIKVAEIISKNLVLIEALEKHSIENNFTPLMYESGLNLILSQNTKHSMTKKSKFLNNKMLKSAKNVTAQFEEFGIAAYINNFEKCLQTISQSKVMFNLVPEQNDINIAVDESNKNFIKEAFNFYHSFLVDMFNFGKMHNEQFGSKKTTSTALDKYAFNSSDNKQFEKVLNYLHSNFSFNIENLTQQLKESIASSYAAEENQDSLLNSLQKTYNKFSYSFENLLEKHAWQSYSAGNLYQLKKDDVELVSWKTSHQIDDCIHCRALETGDNILIAKNGLVLSHVRNIDRVAYNIDDIIKISELEGLAYFGHEGCRCFWVPAKTI